MIGITGYGGYVPRLRMSRQSIVEANIWYAPHLRGKGKGARSLANWDEDSLTMAVAAARDCLGAADECGEVRGVFLASCTLPFAERLNAAVLCEALTLNAETEAMENGGALTAGLSAVSMGLAKVRAAPDDCVLVVAADSRRAKAASPAELEYGDGAASLLLGSENVLAEYLGGSALTVDFVDHFRMAGEDISYGWEERWIRDEGVMKFVPNVVTSALAKAGVRGEDVTHLVFPTPFRGVDAQVAARCGVKREAVAADLIDKIGEAGSAHPILVLSYILESACPGAIIVVAQFGSGARALVFRVTDKIGSFKPAKGVTQWLRRGADETSYTKFLSFNGQLDLERGMRGEQDRKTALSTAYRHRSAILGLVAGKCSVTGDVHFPPSRISYARGEPLQDTQEPYKLANRTAKVLSWSSEYLSFHRAPPHTYGQIDFEGGGRILMEFTDIDQGEIDAGVEVEMTFRIKDIDDRRSFTRYFWKATPTRRALAASE